MFKQLMDSGEEQVTKFATRLLSDEKFVVALQSVMERSLRTREVFEMQAKRALSYLSVPLAEDISELSSRISILEAQLEHLTERLRLMEDKNNYVSKKRRTVQKSRQ